MLMTDHEVVGGELRRDLGYVLRFSNTVQIQDWQRIRRAIEQLPCSLTVAPVLASPHRRRSGRRRRCGFPCPIRLSRGHGRPDAAQVCAACRYACRCGLSGQARSVLFHIKQGREHCDVVWSRIDTDNGKAVQIAFDRHVFIRFGANPSAFATLSRSPFALPWALTGSTGFNRGISVSCLSGGLRREAAQFLNGTGPRRIGCAFNANSRRGGNALGSGEDGGWAPHRTGRSTQFTDKIACGAEGPAPPVHHL